MLATPDHKDTTLSNTAFHIAFRLRFALPPLTISVAQCRCRANYTVDPWHSLSCHLERSTSHTRRHHHITTLVRHWADKCYAICSIQEPKGIDPNSHKRPDLLIEFPSQAYLLDISVRHPLAPSYVKHHPKPLDTATLAEKDKINKYKDIADGIGATFIPFICETTGGLGQLAETFSDHLLPSSDDPLFTHHPRWDLKNHFFTSLGVCIQRGNAECVLLAEKRNEILSCRSRTS